MREQSLAAKTEDRAAEPRAALPRDRPAKEVEAQKMLTAVLPTQTSNVNVFAGSMQPITEARITGNKWF
jgi:hypothetical protein